MTRLFDDVQRRLLANGMEVLVREDHAAPIVALNFFVRVGSLNEDDATAGWSHGIEHMLFKGTARRGPGDIAREIQNAGGDTNAGTGYESTNYYIVLPTENFRVALDIHADVLMNSTFDETELDKEREVLIKENEMYRDQPSGYGHTWEALLAAAFTRHRYGRPIGGPDANLRAAPRDVILAHKRRYYVPNNITYVVVGDVKAEEVFGAMEETFRGWPAAELTPDRSPAEPPQEEFRYVELRRDVEKTYVKIGFHVPPELRSDTDALRVLAHILAAGRSSRLYRRVREEEGLILDCAVLDATGVDPGYLVVEFSCVPERCDAAVEAVYREILRFRDEPATPAELERALRAVVAGTVFGLETMERQASLLGHYALLGDWRLAGSSVERMSRVDAAQIRDAARRHLGLERSTLLVLAPEDGAEAPETATAVGDRLRRALGGVREAGRAAADAGGPAPLVSVPSFGGGERGEVEVVTLDCGTKVILQVDRRLPLVAVSGCLPTGSGAEDEREAGTANLAQMCMTKGAAGMTAAEFADALERLGARLRPFTTRDASGFNLGLLRDDLSRGLELVGAMLARPEFPPDAVERERGRVLAELAALRDDTVHWAMVSFYGLLFPGHAYGRPVPGAEEALRALNGEDLRRWHRAAWDPARLVVGVVGDFDRDRTLRDLEGALGAIRPEGPFPEVPAPAGAFAPRRLELEKDVAQAVVVIGGPGPDLASGDRHALEVWDATLSGMGNRLFTSLREEKHMCYFTGAIFSPLRRGGMLGAYVGTGVDQVDAATDALVAELERSVREAPEEVELRRAQNTLVGSHFIDMQTRLAWASTYARDEALGLGWEEENRFLDGIRAVTAERVREAAARHLDPSRLAAVVLRPGAAAAEEV